jgi:hypothetical protein
MEKSIYEIQKKAVTIDHNSLLLITDPSEELIKLAYQSYMSKIIAGLPLKLNSRMLIIFTNYESNVLKKKMLIKRKYEEV